MRLLRDRRGACTLLTLLLVTGRGGHAAAQLPPHQPETSRAGGSDPRLPLPGRGATVAGAGCWCIIDEAFVVLAPQSIFVARRGVIVTPTVLDLTVETLGRNAAIQFEVLGGGTQIYLQGVGFGGAPVPQGWDPIPASRSPLYPCSGTVRELLRLQAELELKLLDRYIRARIGASPPHPVRVKAIVEHEVELGVRALSLNGLGWGALRLGKVSWKREFVMAVRWNETTGESSEHQAEPKNPPVSDPTVDP